MLSLCGVTSDSIADIDSSSGIGAMGSLFETEPFRGFWFAKLASGADILATHTEF